MIFGSFQNVVVTNSFFASNNCNVFEESFSFFPHFGTMKIKCLLFQDACVIYFSLLLFYYFNIFFLSKQTITALHGMMRIS